MIDRRQFFLTNKKCQYGSFLEQRCCDFWIYYHPETRITCARDLDGVDWFIIGQAYRADMSGKTAEEAIRAAHTHDVPECSFYWSGKWALVGNGALYSDCVGMDSMYYWQKAGKWCAASSLHVLIAANKDVRFPEMKLIKNISFDWFPAPLTCIESVYRTYPSQFLVISKERIAVSFRETLQPLYVEASAEEKKEQLCKYMTNIIRNICLYSNRDLWLALTGGADSRAILSVLEYCEIPFVAFTFDYRLINKGDKKIPPIIARKYGFEHHLIAQNNPIDNNRLIQFDTHTYGVINDANRIFWATGQFDAIPPNALIIKSAIFEIGRGFYYSILPDNCDIRNEIYRVYPDLATFGRYKESLDLWFDWCEEHPSFMDDRDRLYYEQRNGGWIANLEQAIEIAPQEAIHPANCAAVVSIFAAFTKDEVAHNAADNYLINSLCPALLDIPINPRDRLRMARYYYYKIKNEPISSFKKGIARLTRVLRQ